MPIGSTAKNAFWSEDRQRFVRADQLQSGEQLRGLTSTLTVSQVLPRDQESTVYNIEVHLDDVYHITTSGILVLDKAQEASQRQDDVLPEGVGNAGTGGAPRGEPGSCVPDRTLPTDKHGVPIPNSDYPHTQLGHSKPKYGAEPQAREWDFGSNGKLQPQRDIDFTNHGHPEAPPHVPHQNIS